MLWLVTVRVSVLVVAGIGRAEIYACAEKKSRPHEACSLDAVCRRHVLIARFEVGEQTGLVVIDSIQRHTLVRRGIT